MRKTDPETLDGFDGGIAYFDTSGWHYHLEGNGVCRSSNSFRVPYGVFHKFYTAQVTKSLCLVCVCPSQIFKVASTFGWRGYNHCLDGEVIFCWGIINSRFVPGAVATTLAGSLYNSL